MTQAGIVYFLTEGTLPERLASGKNFYIKVGFTRAKSSTRRRLECQVGNPRPLELVAEFSGSCLVENRFHRLFADHRKQGEWFLLDGRYIEAIVSYQGTNGQALFEHLRESFRGDLRTEAV